jgi:hypothetical protein
LLIAGEDIATRCVPAESEHRRMLEQKKRVTDSSSFARSDNFCLNPQAFGIRQASELKQVDVHEIG